MDSTLITFDSTVITWDAGLNAGTASLTFATGPNLPLPLANVRTQAFQYDRRMFRSPYGTVWHQEGDARRLVEEVTLSAFVVDDASGISSAAITANSVANAAVNATGLQTPFGSFTLLGLVSYSRSPMESGYRLDFRFVTQSGLEV